MDNEALDKMTKLANELCDQLEKAEAENKSLKEQLAQVKTASAEPAKAPVVSAEVAQATCDAMVKAGCLTADQVELVKQAFTEDPDAIHRAVVELLNAPAQEKTASSEADLSGGTLVGTASKSESDPYAAVFETLGLNI